jgi:hypothetical protein
VEERSISPSHWLYVALTTEGAVHGKSRKLAHRLLPVLIVLTALGVPVTAAVRPQTMHNFSEYPLAYLIPLAECREPRRHVDLRTASEGEGCVSEFLRIYRSHARGHRGGAIF